MSLYLPEVLSYLKEAGWYPDRTVNISPMVDSLESRGFTVFPSVKDFLKEFGGLVIRYYPLRSREEQGLMTEKNLTPILRVLNFDILSEGNLSSGCRFYDKEMQTYMRLAEQPLCIIGDDSSYFHILLMDPNGHVYGAEFADVGDGEFIQLGDSASEAISNLILGKTLKAYKWFAPYNENRLYEFFKSAHKFVSMGHNPLDKSHQRAGWPTDKFLRDQDYAVYIVQPDVSTDVDSSRFSSIDEVPKPIDAVVCHDYKRLLEAVEMATALEAKVIFPSFASNQPEIQKIASEANIEYIRRIGIEEAYKKVMQI